MEISEEKLDELKEQSYIQGQRMLLLSQLREIMSRLSYTDDMSKERLILHLEETRMALRGVCGDHGDNDWNDHLHLADVINKHLRNHLD